MLGRRLETACRHEVEQEMRNVIAFHQERLRAEAMEVPEPRTYSTYVEVSA